ncbi:MAG: ABC transporter substrate-binding protein [Gammaproteobacteria bacterium]|nr:ABC transporter substrate-binding protein [Gammaproteobacteria bacterium]MBL6999504.1 ABC transporter substrate-binding protein [Gammaproteobacteria bacterium]
MSIKTLTTAFILIWLSLLQSPLFAAESAPEQLIRQTADEVLATIKTNQDEYKQQPARLYAMVDEKVLPHFDFERMTDLALGRYKRQVEAAQREKLVQAFRNLLVRTYGKALLEYTNQKILYLPMRGKLAEGEVTIRTEIEQQGGFPIPINYEMYIKDGSWKVFDISIDNISLVTNYRSSFAQEIKAKGVDSLIKTLQDKNKQES